ncbi:hypothetical protein D3C76_1342870 [compost metagenome]
MNAGVLRHIGDGVGQHAVYGISDIGVGGLEGAFNRVACTVVLIHLVAVLRGGDDGDIRFGRDVIAHVALRDVSVQVVDDDLQINRAAWTNHIAACGHLLLKHFLQQETQIARGRQGHQLVVTSDFRQRLVFTLICTVDAHGDAHQAWILLRQRDLRRNINGGGWGCTAGQHKQGD